MSNGFDAYHKWLSIPPHDQPPNHYRLLGLGLFESDPDVVAAAADRQMAHVQTYKTGPHSELSQKLLNEISAAKLCLLRPQKKSVYDEQLRQQLAASPAGFGNLGGSNGGDAAAARSGAKAGAAGTAAANMGRTVPSYPAPSYPGMSGATVKPPPPALPPPVADAPANPLLGTMTILIAAGVVAVLLLIGIVVVLNHRNGHEPSPGTVGNPDVTVTPETPGPPNPAITPTQPPTTQTNQNPGTQNQATQNQANQNTSAGNTPKSTNPFESSGFNKGDGTAKTDDHGKKPSDASGNDVATTVPPVTHPLDKNHADKNHTDKPNPDKTVPDKTNPHTTFPDITNPDKTVPKVTPVKPAIDPALAGKAAVPDAGAIAAAEQKLGPAATDVSAADLLELAHNAAESSEIYVLLRRALDAAIKLGDAPTAISTVDELVRRFAVNSLEVRLQALTELQARVRTSAATAAVATAESALIDEAMTSGQPDTVQKLAEMSIVAARKSADADVIRRVTLRIIRLRNPSAAPSP
jgi:hypothetical protein